MAELLIQSQLDAHRARNEKLLALIGARGADLDRPRPIDFFFYADDEETASALARDLSREGFADVHVSDEPRDGKWSIKALRNDSVAVVTDEAFVRRVLSFAAKHLADFDGWGTPI